MAAPSKFAHVVYQTHRFEEMIDWYTRVFEATVRHRDDKLAFFSYDDEHHRMAFLNLGPIENGGAPKKASGVGVHHVAYTWKDLGELVALRHPLAVSTRRLRVALERRHRREVGQRRAAARPPMALGKEAVRRVVDRSPARVVEDHGQHGQGMPR